MKPQTITIRLAAVKFRSYPIIIGDGLLAHAAEYLQPGRYAVITDAKVAALYGRDLVAQLNAAGSRAELISFHGGEKAKTRRTKAMLEDRLLRGRYDRKAVVIALGGGVVGDVAGYTAATYLRGITVVQIPTTLVAQVDSSIGGKTGINHPLGKNLIGAFHQPVMVLIDPLTQRSLPRRDLLNGVAEIIKHGVIRSAALFRELERNIASIVDPAGGYSLGELIAKNCRIKAQVVMSDEHESGVRRILNYGHTIGHAVEILSGGRINHGEAVAIGMAAEADIAAAMGLLAAAAAERIRALIISAGLPSRIPRAYSTQRVFNATRLDKKAAAGKALYSIPDRIGRCLHGIAIDDNIVREAIRRNRA